MTTSVDLCSQAVSLAGQECAPGKQPTTLDQRIAVLTEPKSAERKTLETMA